MRIYTELSTIIIILCLIFTGCVSSSKESEEFVKVYDYKNIYVNKDYLEISDNDIQSIIYMDFASKDNYEIMDKDVIEEEDIVLLTINCSDKSYNCSEIYYEVGFGEISEYFDSELIGKSAFDKFNIAIEIEGEIVGFGVQTEGIYVLKDTEKEKNVLEFYEYDTIEEVHRFIKNRAKNEIVFNYMWEKIKENSHFTQIPPIVEEQLLSEISQLSNQADDCGKTLEEYLEMSGVTLESIKQNIQNYYFELILAETILSKENIVIDDNMKLEYKKKQAEINNLSMKEVDNYLSDEDVYYSVVMQELKKVLVSYINVE